MKRAQQLVSYLSENKLSQDEFEESFVRNLDTWLKKPTFENAQFFIQNKDKIPEEFKTVEQSHILRGVVFRSGDFRKSDAKERLLNLVNEGSMKPRQDRPIQSWTTDPSVADDFGKAKISTEGSAFSGFPVVGLKLSKPVRKSDIIMNISALCESDYLRELQNKTGDKIDTFKLLACQQEKEIMVEADSVTKDQVDEIIWWSIETEKVNSDTESKVRELENLEQLKKRLQSREDLDG